jgi:hypothetical protein
MTVTLVVAGDTYTAPDGTTYTLTAQSQLDPSETADTLIPMSAAQARPGR